MALVGALSGKLPEAAERIFARLAEGREPLSERFRREHAAYLARPALARSLGEEGSHLAAELGAEGRCVLDLGCGSGLYAVMLALAGARRVVAADPAGGKFADGRAIAAAAGVPEGRIDWIAASAEALPLRDGSVDAVLARESLSHVPSVRTALAEAARATRPGGTLLVRDYNNAWNLLALRERRAFREIAERSRLRWDGTRGPSHLDRRAAMLRRWFPQARPGRLRLLAERTRGHYGEGLFVAALNALGTGSPPARAEFPFRDPEHGAAEERAFTPGGLARAMSEAGFAPRALRPRHFAAPAGGWRGRFAAWRSASIPALHPLSLLWSPVVEAAGTRRTSDPAPSPPGSPRASSPPRLPKVSVVIPSLDGRRGGNVGRLLEDLGRQTLVPASIDVVVGISPCGKAHNEGARRAKGEILVFLDDDVRLGADDLLERLVRTLFAHPDVGIAGASQLVSPESGPFARLAARTLPRATYPVVEEVIDTDMATHACMAIRRDLYEEVGGEPETLIHADDQVLRARVRQSGFRVAVAPLSWVFHPLPAALPELLRRRLRQGVASAHDLRRAPHLLYEPGGAGAAPPRVLPFPLRALRAGGTLAGDLWRGRWLPVASRLFHAAGLVAGTIGWARFDVWLASARPRPARRRRRLLLMEYTQTRYQRVDRELLSRFFRVDSVDYQAAGASPWRWWLGAARRLARSRGALCWFADRHALILSALGRVLGKPVAVVIGGYETARLPAIGYGSALSRGGRWTRRGAFALSRRIVANSDFIRGELLRTRLVSPRRAVRIHHGVEFPSDPDRFVPFPREDLALTVAEITPANLRRKGLLTFVEAARRAPSYRWCIVGPAEKEPLAELLRDAPPNLEYLGPFAERQLPGIYRRARFYVQISLYEGFGMALAEAMLYGCVPITTGVASLPEVTGGLGRVVPPEDPEALARAVLAGVPSREEHEAAAARIRSEFPLSRRAEALAALFGEGPSRGGRR